MKTHFYKNFLKKTLIWLLLFVLILPLHSLAQIETYTEQEASELNSKSVIDPPLILHGWHYQDGNWYYYYFGIRQFGWLYLNDGTYYLDPNNGGARANGFYTVRGRQYYFNPNMYTGWLEIDGGAWFYYQQNGVLARGLVNAGGVLHYFDEWGVWQGAAQGWVHQGGKWYFYVDGIKQKGLLYTANNWYFLDRATGEMRICWVFDDGFWFYAFDSGILAKNKVDINGQTYYFSQYCEWLGYSGWQHKNGKWYYVIDGVKLEDFQDIEGSVYYFDEADGCAMVTGRRTIEGDEYYFDSSGRMVRGALIDFGSGEKYYYDYSGIGKKAIGWVYENGGWRFKWADGTYLADEYLYLDGNGYRFDENGVMLTGWYTLYERDCYSLPSGVALMNGSYVVDGTLYFFDINGAASVYEGWLYENGKWYFYVDGEKYVGFLPLNGTCYYMDDDGSMHTGWLYDGDAYLCMYFKESGAIAQNETLVIDGVSYKFDPYGCLIENGWICYGSYWYYFDNGIPVRGWLNLNGVKYYLDSGGAMHTGWLELEDTSMYFFTPSGNMVTGTVWADGKLCVFDEEGLFFDYYRGWREENGKWYYYNNDGTRRIGWLKLGNNWYYLLAPDGEMATGTVNAGGVMHVFDENGVWLHAL